MSTIAKYTTVLLLGFTVVAHSLCAEEAGRDTLGHVLLEAVRNHNTQKIDDLLYVSPDLVNYSATPLFSPLHVACRSGYANIVLKLLQHGADANCALFDDETPLHCAVSEGHHEIVQLLLRHGAFHSPVYELSGDTALHCAADDGFVEICLTLLQQGADIDSRNRKNQTPLHAAADAGTCETAELLISHGADIHAIDTDGHTPLSLLVNNARYHGNESLLSTVQLLIRYGGVVTDEIEKTLRDKFPRYAAQIEKALLVEKQRRVFIEHTILPIDVINTLFSLEECYEEQNVAFARKQYEI